ncbi:hypothetical protein VSAK1_02869 [Vibrio mediterranei AK1]|uniref:hypothetical protein n=1 Tax=Vibrio mediterranei TaxID=689 RepID=UPI0001540B1E|nr:hypothetical protein [Vibrio mediterranei]EDL54980.1 hypothetical protein VSAK1_02869 [Vibrio mediterranei AK1]
MTTYLALPVFGKQVNQQRLRLEYTHIKLIKDIGLSEIEKNLFRHLLAICLFSKAVG